MIRHRRNRALAALLLAVGLAACGRKDDAKNLDTLDNQLVAGNAADPALTGALHDQIMVDPALAQHANGDAIRPPGKPYSAEMPPGSVTAGDGVPAGAKLAQAPGAKAGAACPECATHQGAVTLGDLAARQKNGRTSDCAANVRYSARWAARMPADLPVYPGANVSEAAGNDANGCALRVVSFASAAPVQRVLDYYYTQARKAGYTADRQADGDQQVLGGTRGDDAYVLFVKDRAGGGSEADLVVNTGS